MKNGRISRALESIRKGLTSQRAGDSKEEVIEDVERLREIYYSDNSEKDAICRNFIKCLEDGPTTHDEMLCALYVRETLAGSIPLVLEAAQTYLIEQKIWTEDLVKECKGIRSVMRDKKKYDDPDVRAEKKRAGAQLRSSIRAFKRPYALPPVERESSGTAAT
jgi:hypothetical protein